jgi:hypothetical protein
MPTESRKVRWWMFLIGLVLVVLGASNDGGNVSSDLGGLLLAVGLLLLLIAHGEAERNANLEEKQR